jgi:SAM-dependent methyltransferase
VVTTPGAIPRDEEPAMTTTEVAYDTLAEVYEWLVPEPLLTPEGAADAFASVVGHLPAGGRILDCAAGTGQLAVGLALRGFNSVASDASPAMVERTRALADKYRTGLPAVTCDWASLDQQGWLEPFDAVLCVGNSIAHAGPARRRRAALSAMAGLLCDGGVLALTSRNWDLIRAQGPGLRVADRLTRRADRKGLVLYSWELSESAGRPHHVDVAVALVADDERVTTHRERLEYWPFGHDELVADLHAVGLALQSTTYTNDVERYLVIARRPADG